MLATLKKLSAVALAGAIVGMLVASLVAPRFITWYVTPGAQGQALCNCPELATSVIGQLLKSQLTGAVIGAVLALVIGVIVLKSRRGAQPSAVAGGGDVPPAP